MSNQKAAELSGTLLARKGSAAPAGVREPGQQEFDPGDVEDGIFDPVDVVELSGNRPDGAALAPELLNVRTVSPGLGGGSTALRAGPRPESQRVWGGEDDVTQAPHGRTRSSRRIRWRLILIGAAVLAAILAGLYGRGSGPDEAAQDAAGVSSPPTTEPPVLAGKGTAFAALPPLAGTEAPTPIAQSGKAELGAAVSGNNTFDTPPWPQEFAALPEASERATSSGGPITAGLGLTPAALQTTAVPKIPAAAASADAPQAAPPRPTRVAALRPDLAVRTPQQKPDSPLNALLTNGGDGVFVQLGSVKTAVGAMREWDKLVGQFPGVLSGRALKIERVALANRGAFYRIRTGPISGLTRARAICAEFAARDRGCLVVRR